MERCSFHFDGRVQGVGFRATTQQIARGLGLTGWVRNLSDGRVEAAVQGPTPEVEQLLAELRDRFGDGLEQVVSRPVEPLADDESFRIRY